MLNDDALRINIPAKALQIDMSRHLGSNCRVDAAHDFIGAVAGSRTVGPPDILETHNMISFGQKDGIARERERVLLFYLAGRVAENIIE